MSTSRQLVVGALAGGVGTAAMDLLLYRRYRHEGGKEPLWRWESAVDVMSWNEASAPGQLGQKLERFVTGQPPADSWARTTTKLVHWATGIGWGLQYGLLASRSSKHRWLQALALGPVVWLSGYAVLPLAKVYEPIWKYDARTLGKDLSAHVVVCETGDSVEGRCRSGKVEPTAFRMPARRGVRDRSGRPTCLAARRWSIVNSSWSSASLSFRSTLRLRR